MRFPVKEAASGKAAAPAWPGRYAACPERGQFLKKLCGEYFPREGCLQMRPSEESSIDKESDRMNSYRQKAPESFLRPSERATDL